MLLLPLCRLTPPVSSPTGEEELQKVCSVSRFPKLDAYAAEGERALPNAVPRCGFPHPDPLPEGEGV